MSLVQDIHTFVNFLSRQGQAKYFNPEEIDDAMNNASLALFEELKKEGEKTSLYDDKLRPFKTSDDISLTSGAGTIPSTVAYITQVAEVSGSDEYEVDILRDSEYQKRKNSLITPPASQYGICRIDGDTINVLPTSISDVRLYNLKYPVVGVFGYTTSGDGRTPVFSAGSTTELDWDENAKIDLIARTLRYLRIPLNKPVLDKIDDMKIIQDANK